MCMFDIRWKHICVQTWKQGIHESKEYKHTKFICFCRPDVHFQWERLYSPISLHPIFRKKLRKVFHSVLTLHKKWSFLLRISSVNVTESAVNCGFGEILRGKLHFCVVLIILKDKIYSLNANLYSYQAILISIIMNNPWNA